MLGYLYFGRGYFGEDGIRGVAIEIATGTIVLTGMRPSLRRLSVSLELNGYNNGWTDVTRDMTSDPIRIARGFQSIAPDDLVAAPAVCQFSLNNSVFNVAKQVGYYAPDNAAALPGFDSGIRVKVEVVANGNAYTRFLGWIYAVSPHPGLYEEQTTAIMATSWLRLAAGTLAEGLSVQTSQRGDQLVALLAAVPTFPPPATQYAVGIDAYPYAFDDLSPSSYIVDGFDSVAKSGLDRIWEKADGTLVYESRSRRQLGAGPVMTLTDKPAAARPGQAVTTFPLRRDLATLYNAVKVTVHPKKIDPAPVVLYSYQTSASSASIAPGTSITLEGPFQDPNQLAQSVAGVSMLTSAGIGTSGALPITDWQITTAPNGGADISSSCTVTVVYTATKATFTITNSSSVIGYIAKLQCRGQGVYNYQVVSASSVNAAVANLLGKQSTTIDCPYQAAPSFAQTLADYLLYAYGQRRSHLDAGVTLEVPTTDELTADALMGQVEISQAVAVQESVTGLTSTFWVNHLDEAWDEFMNLSLVLQLAPMTIQTLPTGAIVLAGRAPAALITGVPIPIPAGNLSFAGQLPTITNAPLWKLGVAGNSELGQTTNLN